MSLNRKIYRNSDVRTADGRRLGTVQGLYRRPEGAEVDPDLKLFAYYMEVVNLDIGDDFYVPTDYIERIDGGEIWLTRNFDEIQGETLMREPRFIAHGNGLNVHLLDRPGERS